MINLVYVPTFEELIKGVRSVKIKLPDRDKTLKEERKIFEVTGATYSDTDTAHVNDVVTLMLCGGKGKYNSQGTEIWLGKNFFNKDIEDAVVGLKIYESKDVEVDGTTVSVTLLSAKSKHYSEITLEKVQETLPEIKSLEEFDNFLYKNVVDKLINDTVYNKIAKTVCNKIKAVAKIEFDDSDMGEDLKRYTEKYRIPENEHRDIFLQSQVYFKIMKEKGLIFDENGYEAYIKQRAKEKNVDIDTMKERFPFFMYKYVTLEKKFIEYVKNYAKENMVTIVD